MTESIENVDFLSHTPQHLRVDTTDKSTEIKAALPVGALIPQPHGGAIRNGGTNVGGSGRPPNVFKQFLAKLRADPEFHATLERAAKDDSSRGYGNALKIITDYDDDKPAEKRQVGGAVEVHVVFTREGRKTTSG